MLNTVAICLSTTPHGDLSSFFFRSFCLDTKQTKKSRTPQGFPKIFSSSDKCWWYEGLAGGYCLRITHVAHYEAFDYCLVAVLALGVCSEISKSLKLRVFLLFQINLSEVKIKLLFI